MKRAPAIALFAAVMALSGAASAHPAARLVYTRGPGAEQCPDEDAMRSAVASRLGYDPFVADADTTVRVRVVRSGEGYDGEVKLSDRQGVNRGTRRLRERACADLITTLALTVSIAVDPVSGTRPPQTVAAPDPPPPPPPPPLPPPPQPQPPPQGQSVALPYEPAPRRAPPLVSHVDVYGDLRVGVGLGVTPGAGPSTTLGVVVGLDWLKLGLDLRFDGSAPVAAKPTGKVEGLALLGTFCACGQIRWFFAGPTATFGAVRAGSTEITNPASAWVPFVGVGGRVGAQIDLNHRLAILAGGGTSFSLKRYTITIDGAEAYRSALVTGEVNIGLRVHIR